MLMQMKKSVCFDNAKVGRKVFIGKKYQRTPNIFRRNGDNITPYASI
jgi:hypothetical protein